MKTFGIAMLFGLCSMIGIRIAAGKTARLNAVRTLSRELIRFAERISGGDTLKTMAAESGMLSGMLSVYLTALENGETEARAAALASDEMKNGSAEQSGACAFLTGLSAASRHDTARRTESFKDVLARAQSEAEAESKQARVIRISGVLVGAGLAILLL